MKKAILYILLVFISWIVNAHENNELYKILFSGDFVLEHNSDIWLMLEKMTYDDYKKNFPMHEHCSDFNKRKRFYEHQKKLEAMVLSYKNNKNYEKAINVVSVWLSLSMFSGMSYSMQESAVKVLYEIFHITNSENKAKILLLNKKIITLTSCNYCEKYEKNNQTIIFYANKILFIHFVFTIMDVLANNKIELSIENEFTKKVKLLLQQAGILSENLNVAIGYKNKSFYLITMVPIHSFYATHNIAIHFGNNSEINEIR